MVFLVYLWFVLIRYFAILLDFTAFVASVVQLFVFKADIKQEDDENKIRKLKKVRIFLIISVTFGSPKSLSFVPLDKPHPVEMIITPAKTNGNILFVIYKTSLSTISLFLL